MKHFCFNCFAKDTDRCHFSNEFTIYLCRLCLQGHYITIVSKNKDFFGKNYEFSIIAKSFK